MWFLTEPGCILSMLCRPGRVEGGKEKQPFRLPFVVAYKVPPETTGPFMVFLPTAAVFYSFPTNLRSCLSDLLRCSLFIFSSLDLTHHVLFIFLSHENPFASCSPDGFLFSHFFNTRLTRGTINGDFITL